MIAACLVYSHRTVRHWDDRLATASLPFLEGAWCLFGFAGLTRETVEVLTYLDTGDPALKDYAWAIPALVGAAVWSGYSAVLTWSEKRLQTGISRIAGGAVAGLAVLVVTFGAMPIPAIVTPGLVITLRIVASGLVLTTVVWTARSWRRLPNPPGYAAIVATVLESACCW